MATTLTKRIEYVDALRGFTMLLVVFQHIATFCWHIPGKGISVHDYLMQIRMPMFFFISGFVLYKTGVVWNLSHIKAFFRKKIPVQLLSPFLFFLVFLHLTGTTTLVDGLYMEDKAGYWFTFVLFEFYVFYAIVRFCIRGWWADVVLVVLSLPMFAFSSSALYDLVPLPSHVKGALSMSQWAFLLFFVLGTLARKYFDRVQQLLDTRWFLPFCIVVYFLFNAFSDVLMSAGMPPIVLRLLLTLAGLCVLFSFFRLKSPLFSSGNRLGMVMQYVGRRTLDIYLIHYFLIPHNLDMFTLFADHPMPVVEATVSLLLAVIVLAASLLIGNIIRLSPLLGHWVFGAKK